MRENVLQGSLFSAPFLSLFLPSLQKYGEEVSGNNPLQYLKMTQPLHTYLRSLYKGAEVQVYL